MASLVAHEDHVDHHFSLVQTSFQCGPHRLEKVREHGGLLERFQHRVAFSPVFGVWSYTPQTAEVSNVVDESLLDAIPGFEVTGQGPFVTGLEG